MKEGRLAFASSFILPPSSFKLLRRGGDSIINRRGATRGRVSALKSLDLPSALG
jgi:hypothetical protein